MMLRPKIIQSSVRAFSVTSSAYARPPPKEETNQATGRRRKSLDPFDRYSAFLFFIKVF